MYIFVIKKITGYGLSEEASAMICTIKNPIAVISVAGLYRTGKSYLLNRIILNRTNGFGVGPTVNPCTKVKNLKYFFSIGTLGMGNTNKYWKCISPYC